MEDVYNLIVDKKYGNIFIVEVEEIEKLEEKWPDRFRKPTEEETKWFALMTDYGRPPGYIDLFYFDEEKEIWEPKYIMINVENIRSQPPPWKRDFLFSGKLNPEM